MTRSPPSRCEDNSNGLDLSKVHWVHYWLHITLLIAITFLVFSNTLENEFHLDSVYRVEQNTEIEKFWPPSRFFTDIRTGSTIPQIAEYRPMMPLSHSVDSEVAQFTGIDKLTAFHIGNIVIHTGSAILVYFLFYTLLINWGATQEGAGNTVSMRRTALAAALIFAIHPISGSAVNYLAARDLLLMVFFFISFFLVYTRMRTTGDSLSGWAASLLFLSLAILSKQVAIMGFGLVFLFELILVGKKLSNWKLWFRTLVVAIPTALYFVLRSLWISKQNPDDPLRTFQGFDFPITMLDAHTFYYLRNFFWPFEMRALAKVDLLESILEPSALIGLAVITSSLVAAWWLRNRQPVISFSILAYWCLFSLTASIFPFRYVVTDYRQYLPLMFLSLTVTLLIFSTSRKKLALTVLSGFVLYLSIASYYINTHWKTEESFWHQSVKYGAVALAHQNYALVIARENPELAEHHYLEALRQHPFHIYASINLGMLHIRMGKEEEGLLRLQNMVALNPSWALAHYWLSEGLKLTGQKEEALKEITIAADLDPRSLAYQYAAARELQKVGDHSEAIPYFERIISLNPKYKSAGFWLGFAYQKTGQPQQAIYTYRRFLEHNSDYFQAHFNLAYELMGENDCQTALVHFNKVLELRPSYREVHLHLSRCYRALGDENLTEKHLNMFKERS